MKKKNGFLRLTALLAIALASAAVLSAGVWAEEEEPNHIYVEESEYQITTYSDFSDLLPLSEDELIYQYLNKNAPQVSSRVLLRSLRPVTLTGNNLIIFNELMSQINDVANGRRTSTVFSVDISELYLDGKLIDFTKEYSESDVGITGCCTYDPTYTDANGKHLKWDEDKIDQVVFKMTDMLGFDFNLIRQALVSACPYELYWSAKDAYYSTVTVNQSVSYYDSNESYVCDGVIFRYSNQPISFSFTVDANFAGSGNYTVDTEKTQSTNSAVINAGKIITEAKYKTDYDKLVYYKERICELVTYDEEAAKHLDDDSYPNSAWQMINVFDGDSNTNVVCEGYSKAFQFLCDHTEFSGNIYCFCPSGVMGGGTGAGRHMWNIVRMDDELYYLVDVTNCDGNSIGSPDYLFLKGYSSYDETNDQYTYSFTKGSTVCNVIYKYNNDSKALFLPEELAVSPTAYTPIVTHQLSLGGKIGVIFNLGDGVVVSGTPTATIDGKNIKDIENAAGHITVYINSIQMAEPITLTFSYTKGTDTTVYTYSGKYSAMEYINSYYALPDDQRDETTENLVRALHKYGYYIRLFLEEVHEDADYSSYETMDYIDPPFPDIDLDVFPYTPNVSDLADSEITASYLLRFDSGTDIQVTLSGEIYSVDVSGEEYQGDFHKIIIPSILPQKLDSVYGISAIRSSVGAFTIEISALSYIWSVLKSDKYKDDEVAKNAMQALFYYYKATKLYIDP